jgi:cation transport regulator
MPYESLQALPFSLRKHLPLRAQEIYCAAFNAAWEQYAELLSRQGPAALEETVSRTAWAAVRRKYRQDPVTRQWRLLAGDWSW